MANRQTSRATGSNDGALSSDYSKFLRIDGSHDFKKAVPGAFVEYKARRLHGGKVAYLNFALAKEMGLLPKNHAHELNPALQKAVLEAFALRIINEYDLEKKIKYPEKDIKPNTYMATRYLQLQHPSRTGVTSGDGRSIWNGQFTARGVTWDVTSCGTGSTCLSPAAAILGKIPRTGDPKVAYGCGRADLQEGLSGAILSEIFHRNGIPTERTLAVIEFENGAAINVRAGQCLLRPSHFFGHLRQNQLERLKASFDFFVTRMVKNGNWPIHFLQSIKKNQYEPIIQRMASEFARMAALFEADYIFVWMDWDGDNILANAGIIDYGSVRQFGLFHHHYRYDDDGRWSTTIKEQRKKARETVQSFLQLADFLRTKKKRPLSSFSKHPTLSIFDQSFEETLNRRLLYKVGTSDSQAQRILKDNYRAFKDFQKAYTSFERASRERFQKVADGITREALFCMRTLLRETPKKLLSKEWSPERTSTLSDLIHNISSSNVTRRHKILTPKKESRVRHFLNSYLRLFEKDLSQISERASIRNPSLRVTGDAIVGVTEKLIRESQRGLKPKSLQNLVETFISSQVIEPGSSSLAHEPRHLENKILQQTLKIVEEYRESL